MTATPTPHAATIAIRQSIRMVAAYAPAWPPARDAAPTCESPATGGGDARAIRGRKAGVAGGAARRAGGCTGNP
jgi:hypothetical protein